MSENFSMTKRYDWVVFDSTGTLMEPSPPAAMVYHEFGQRYGDRQSIDEVQQRLKASITRHFFGDAADTPTDEDRELARWRLIVADTLPSVREPEFETLFQELWQRFATAENWQLFHDTLPVLKRLKASGYRLALASNFDLRLATISEQLKISEYFDQMLISSQVGWSKPSRNFYDSATRKIEMESHRDRVLMIGDTLAGDVIAAQAAGWDARHLVREHANALVDLTKDL